MLNPKSNRCYLCLQERELRESHLLPKALYRLVRAGTRSPNAHALQITRYGRQSSSRQATQPLLCAECESRFDRCGENWVLRHCYRGRGRFRLRTMLEQSQPLYTSSDLAIYCGSHIPEVNVEQLVYFCISVFWRASVKDWWSSGHKYESINLGTKYQEEIRRYLLGDLKLPDSFAVTVILSNLTKPVLAFNFPVSSRIEGAHSHRLHIPGMTFLLAVGKQAGQSLSEIDILRSASHPIFVSTDGDRRVQKEILAMMGKVAPAWAEYPLTEGVETA